MSGTMMVYWRLTYQGEDQKGRVLVVFEAEALPARKIHQRVTPAKRISTREAGFLAEA
jgi:hypothetical protein